MTSTTGAIQGAHGKDPMTGFLRCESFLAAVDEAITTASPDALKDLWVGTVAIPRLAFVNAGFGREAGDDVIQGLVQILAEELPEAFAMGRLEGTELAVASFGPARRLTLRDTRDPIRFLGIAVETAGTRLFVNVRGGIAFHAPGDDAATLMRKSRFALAYAREGQGSDLETYSDTMGEMAAGRIDIACRLVGAIENGDLSLVYQPKVDIASGMMIGVEALVRWPLPGGGGISPGVFIPAAEASGLIVPLGDWVLREGCRQAARWCAEGLPRFHVALNVSALQFQKTDIVARVSGLIEETGARADWLELEITEGALASDADAMVARLNAIRDLGVELAIDDFGTGYSSLSYLKRFPVHRLKIDQSFVRSAHENAQDRAMVKSIIAMGHNLGLKVIAEGVENAAQVALLTQDNCGEAQGYYYSKPLKADSLAAFIAHRGVMESTQ